MAALVFAVSSIAYTLLGIAVSHGPPRGIDAQAHVLAGHALGLAEIFTKSCLWYVFTPFCIAALIFAALVKPWRGRAIFSVVLLVASWLISNELKNVFMRPRPEYWFYVHESTYSYSSGHAMFAVVVYGLWSVFVFASELPAAVRLTFGSGLALWSLGIIWSRLALGAHYPSDLLGGVLLGIALIAFGSAIAALREGPGITA
ncbi:MAG: hypothetical protein NVS2B17_03860 [Candidatus Velthaea sp.]